MSDITAWGDYLPQKWQIRIPEEIPEEDRWISDRLDLEAINLKICSIGAVEKYIAYVTLVEGGKRLMIHPDWLFRESDWH